MRMILVVGLIVGSAELLSRFTPSAPVSAQVSCLHGAGEAPADAARRVDAIRVMRAINTAQAQAFAQGGKYLSFKGLTDKGFPRRPDGFLTQVTIEGSTYAVVSKDTSDPCGWTIFAVQDGLIYTGMPLQ